MVNVAAVQQWSYRCTWEVLSKKEASESNSCFLTLSKTATHSCGVHWTTYTSTILSLCYIHWQRKYQFNTAGFSKVQSCFYTQIYIRAFSVPFFNVFSFSESHFFSVLCIFNNGRIKFHVGRVILLENSKGDLCITEYTTNCNSGNMSRGYCGFRSILCLGHSLEYISRELKLLWIA